MDEDERRLVYTDDPRLRGLLGVWLDRHELQDAQQRAKLDAAVEEGADVTITGQTAAGDERKLRGIPAVGRGVAGAIANTDPLRALLKSERRSADRDDL